MANASSAACLPQFAPANFVMVRAPLLPLDLLATLFDDPQSTDGLQACTPESPSTFHRDINLNSKADSFASMVGEPAVQEAILAGSPDLFHAVSRWRKAPGSKREQRAQSKLLQYFIRMSSRPTPFGLFAGVALAEIAPEMNIAIGARLRNRKYARPDMQWLLLVIRSLEESPAVIEQLKYSPNNTVIAFSARLYVPRLDTFGQNETEHSASLRATPVVLRALELARHGAKLSDLRQQLQQERPNATFDQIDGVLAELRQKQVLLSELRPPLTGRDPLLYVLDKIKTLSGCDDIRQRLEATLALSDKYGTLTIGDGIPTLLAMHDTMCLPDAKLLSTVEIDMELALERRSFSQSVANEVANAAELLLRLSTMPLQFPTLESYRREFLNRYGTAREVPLLEVLDGEIGIGAPSGYLHPPCHRDGLPLQPSQYPQRERTLLRIAVAAAREGRIEAELDEATLQSLQIDNSRLEAAPNSLDVYAFVAASSQTAIDQGDFTVVVAPRTGEWQAGRSFGRFCHILGHRAVCSISELAHAEESRDPGRIYAELVYLPSHGHAANVAIRPKIRKYEINIGTSSGSDQSHTIAMNDLVVGVRNDRFYVRSVAHNAEVVIRDTHLLNYLAAPNACRFLAEISAEGTTMVHPFDWGPAAQLPFVPRLRVGRAVLCPAEWHLSPEEFSGNEHIVPELGDRIRIWCRDWNIPRYVYLADSDNRLLLDLSNSSCIAILIDQVRKRMAFGGGVVLQEMLPDFSETWSRGVDGRYLLEFVVPLIRRQPNVPPLQSRPLVAISHTEDRMHLPGSSWLYAKLHGGGSFQDDLLSGPLREFAHEAARQSIVKQWFFIRYADPDPHIRLRFHGEPQRLITDLLPALAEMSGRLVAAGFVQKLVLDTYESELERYGGMAGVRLAESIFYADSALVVDVLALRKQKILALALRDIALVLVDDFLAGLGLGAAERLRHYQVVHAEQGPSVGRLEQLRDAFHTYQKRAQRLIGDRAWLRAQPGGAELEALLHRRAALMRPLGEQLASLTGNPDAPLDRSSLLSSYIHMHCNRLFGLDRSYELEVLYHLGRTLDSLKRFTPDGISIS